MLTAPYFFRANFSQVPRMRLLLCALAILLCDALPLGANPKCMFLVVMTLTIR